MSINVDNIIKWIFDIIMKYEFSMLIDKSKHSTFTIYCTYDSELKFELSAKILII